MPTSVDTNVVVLPSGLALQESVSIVAGELVGVSDIYAAESHIQWIKQADGSVVAQMFATTDTNPGQGNRILAEQVFAQDDTNTNRGLSRAVFQAASALPGNQVAGITATQQGGGTTKKVEVTIAGLNPLLLQDAAGRSDFVQKAQVLSRTFTGPWNMAGTAQFTTAWPVAGDALILFGGSGFMGSATNSSLDLYIDGVLTGVLPWFFNQVGVHEFMGLATFGVAGLTAGNHTFAVNNGSPSGHVLMSDLSDTAAMVVIPIP